MPRQNRHRFRGSPVCQARSPQGAFRDGSAAWHFAEERDARRFPVSALAP